MDEYKTAWDDIMVVINEFTDGAIETFGIETDYSTSVISGSAAAVATAVLALMLQ